MSNKTKTKATPAKVLTASRTKRTKKCRALEVGHRRCNCGGPNCGQNIHDPYAR